MDWTQIILAVIALIGTVITTLLVPYIKTKLDQAKASLSNEQLDTLMYWVRTFINAAEEIFTAKGSGADKTDFVIERLRAMGLTFDEDTVLVAIKGLCHTMTVDGYLNKGAPAKSVKGFE